MPPDAVSVTEYATPTLPAANGEELLITTDDDTTNCNACDTKAAAESVKRTVKLNVPMLAVVPAISPEPPVSVMPAGKAPEVIDQV